MAIKVNIAMPANQAKTAKARMPEAKLARRVTVKERMPTKPKEERRASRMNKARLEPKPRQVAAAACRRKIRRLLWKVWRLGTQAERLPPPLCTRSRCTRPLVDRANGPDWRRKLDPRLFRLVVKVYWRNWRLLGNPAPGCR